MFIIAPFKFTFHYASTLSHLRWTTTLILHDLHSTMLLLYLKKTANRQRKAKFTFHYASTLSHIFYSKPHSVLDLHSTMLLLYRFVSELFICSSFYLHSTMLLLYHLCRSCSCETFDHLHSTMLLLYPGPSTPKNPSRKFIYIPLCFYFIEGASAAEVAEVVNLHSTMLLLYHISFSESKTINRIYIPLCFYFIGWGQSVQTGSSGIYIPLCFYFIKYRTSYRRCPDSDLHSTMLLLYLLSGF